MKIALVGNPNTGKSSLFNLLTGLKQHVGNFPGVTVDKKFGTLKGTDHLLIDFPGTYSIYPRSKDEEIVYQVVTNPNHSDFPDIVMVVVDASNLKRNLFLFQQIYDLGLPTIMLLNMTDIARKKGVSILEENLKSQFPNAQIIETNARVGFGKNRIIEAINALDLKQFTYQKDWVCSLEDTAGQEEEVKKRYQQLEGLVVQTQVEETRQNKFQARLDQILVHPIFGYAIFFFVLFSLFQAIFVFASIPMDFIDANFASLSVWTSQQLPEGVFFDLVTQGIIPGIGGVLVFVPQIAFLFLFIAILEESGYLARVVFLMDRWMRPLGLNGKSVVPLLSSVACAIPGVMAARTIADWKERLITILVAPLMSCSARIPVYTLLIALVIPKQMVFGFINLQGMVLFGLYFLGVLGAIGMSLLLKWLIHSKQTGYLILELPSYKLPKWNNVLMTVWEKAKIFVIDAGKVIIAISIVLWFLASFGPGESLQLAEKNAQAQAYDQGLSKTEEERLVASLKLESSYMGHLGKWMEPLIEPLGYDWKIGISLITSFAAREVFVGSLATIYSVHQEENAEGLLAKMKNEKRADGKPVFTLASGVSLMVFYVFAMQCMATLAVVRRETKSWKWPLVQLAFMGVLAYSLSFLFYQLLV